MTQDTVIRETFAVGPLGCNCTLIGNPLTKEAVVIDPGGDPQKITERLQAHGLKLTRILHTHAHFDHFLASAELKNTYHVPLALHKADLPLWQNLESQCAMFGIPFIPTPDPDEWLSDDLDLGLHGGVCMHTPGHSPGSVSFWFEPLKLLIAGDTLFKGSIGRTDLWGGDSQAIINSIKNRILPLDSAAAVVTGHGPETSIEAELRHNPFLH